MKRNWKSIEEFNDFDMKPILDCNAHYWKCTKFLKISEKHMVYDFKPLGLYVKFCGELFDHTYLLKNEKTLYLISGTYHALNDERYKTLSFIAGQLFHKITFFDETGYKTLFALQIGKRISKTTFINNYSTLNVYK